MLDQFSALSECSVIIINCLLLVSMTTLTVVHLSHTQFLAVPHQGRVLHAVLSHCSEKRVHLEINMLAVWYPMIFIVGLSSLSHALDMCFRPPYHILKDQIRPVPPNIKGKEKEKEQINVSTCVYC